MKKFISSILVVFLLLLSSCSGKSLQTYKYTTHFYDGNVVFISEKKMGCGTFKYFEDFPFKKYNIDYLFEGDELYVEGHIYSAGLDCGDISYIDFSYIKRVKIKRAPIINLKVIGYRENGIYKNEIVPINSKTVLDKQYKNQDIIVFTGQNDVKDITCTLDYEYTYETLYNLEEGTKIAATYYEKDGITYIYGFYLRSYVNKVKYFAL